MKARRLSEMRQMAASPEFRRWWENLCKAKLARDEARTRHEDLLGQSMLMDFRAELAQKNAIDTLYRAGEIEDAATKMVVEAQELENVSFRHVAEFEEQRFKTREVWARTGAAERRVEAAREALESARKANLPKGELDRLAAELKRVERVQVQTAEEYARENAAKERLWASVEQSWHRSMELGLLISEERLHGRKVRVEAEALFKQADERKQQARTLRAQADDAGRDCEAAEQRIQDLKREVAEQFGGSQGQLFAYFRQKESPDRAWVVALADDRDGFNVEVKALSLYSVEARRGVEFLEPAVEKAAADAEGERRFEDYFLKGRKGSPGSGEGGEGGQTDPGQKAS